MLVIPNLVILMLVILKLVIPMLVIPAKAGIQFLLFNVEGAGSQLDQLRCCGASRWDDEITDLRAPESARKPGAVKDRRWLKHRRTDVLAKRMRRGSRERCQALIDTEDNLRRW